MSSPPAQTQSPPNEDSGDGCGIPVTNVRTNELFLRLFATGIYFAKLTWATFLKITPLAGAKIQSMVIAAEIMESWRLFITINLPNPLTLQQAVQN